MGQQLSPKLSRRLLFVILLLFTGLGLTFALVTPPFEASDEIWHYPMIQHLAGGGALPVQVFDPAEAGPWKQQASQPPLYYYLGALLTFWIDQSDMAEVRRQNPHVEPGVLTEDGNRNLAVRDPAASPWQGALLAVYVVRIASVLLGLATVYLTFRLGQQLLPDRPDIALLASATLAFTPMFLFISGAINSDNLIIPLAAWACYLMIRLVDQPPATGREALYRYSFLGVVIGLAALAKIPGTGLLLLALGTTFIASWERGERPVALSGLFQVSRHALTSFLIVLLPVLLIAGWWYWRNVQLYGDWRGWSAFIAVLGQRSQPASLAQLWDERWGFMLAFWGLFGGLNVTMPLWTYRLLNSLVVLAIPGGLFFFGTKLRDWWLQDRPTLQPIWQRWLHTLLSLVADFFPWVICLLWSLAIIIGLIQWATVTWSSQGRLVFYALPMLLILWLTGLIGPWPRGVGRVLGGGLVGFLFLLSLLTPWLWIAPTYRPVLGCSDEPQHLVDATFNEQIRLVGYDAPAAAARPGQSYQVRLYWQILAPPEADWSVFVHLNDPVLQIPVAQRDMYLGQGLLASSSLSVGDCLQNEYVLSISPTAEAPAELELIAGLYDFESLTRLASPEGMEAARLTQVALEPRPGALPNTTSVNFGDRFELVGYELDNRRPRSGDEILLTTYWRALTSIESDYTFFAQALEDFGGANRRWAAFDRLPEVSTMTWPVGEVQALTLPLALAPETPAGILPIVIGAYTRTEDGGFANLQLVTPDGRLTNENLWSLTQIRIDER